MIAAAALSIATLSTPGGAEDKAAFLFPGSINDQSWNAEGYAGAERLKSLGWTIGYTENVPAADMVEALKDYAGQGYKVIVGHTGRFLSAMQRVAPDYPNTLFIVGSGSAGAGDNVTSIDYNNVQIGYLTGVLAARMSKSGKIGSVNSLEGLPNIIAQVGGFRKGVKSVNPDAEVKVVYIKGMEDAAEAKEAALSLISGGADFIFGKLNAGHAGIVQAAKEKDVYTSGRSFGHTAIAPDNVLTNIIERWGDMYAATAEASKTRKAGGQYVLYGFEAQAGSGALFKATPDQAFNAAVPEAVAAEIEGLQKKFASGELKVTVTKEDARGGI
jgi:simple sugar transport system substrate-binding protein/basic membrane protein A